MQSNEMQHLRKIKKSSKPEDICNCDIPEEVFHIAREKTKNILIFFVWLK